MMHARINGLSLAFPDEIRPNAYWTEHHPEMVQGAMDRALERLWRRDEVRSEFERAMEAFAKDPFKGALERRVVTIESSVDLAVRAAEKSLTAAELTPSDIDLVIVSTMRPDTIAVGDAAFLAARMGFTCPAINLETACSSSVFDLDTAANLVRMGRYRRILVVTTCTYSRDVEVSNSLAWFLADGAGAFIVESCPEEGYLGGAAIPTPETCGAFSVDIVNDGGDARLAMSANRAAGKILHDTAAPYLQRSVDAGLAAAGLQLSDIDFFVFNTPTAWYANFCAAVLGVSRDRTISTYPIYTNLGPVLMPANLYHAAASGRISRGDKVLLYSVGSSSTAMCAILSWQAGALGEAPRPPLAAFNPA